MNTKWCLPYLGCNIQFIRILHALWVYMNCIWLVFVEKYRQKILLKQLLLSHDLVMCLCWEYNLSLHCQVNDCCFGVFFSWLVSSNKQSPLLSFNHFWIQCNYSQCLFPSFYVRLFGFLCSIPVCTSFLRTILTHS